MVQCTCGSTDPMHDPTGCYICPLCGEKGLHDCVVHPADRGTPGDDVQVPSAPSQTSRTRPPSPAPDPATSSRHDAEVIIHCFWRTQAPGPPTFRCNFDAIGLKGTVLRVAIFILDEAGNPVRNNGDSRYRTPDGKLTAQLDVTPESDIAIFTEVTLSVPFDQFPMGRHTYSALLQVTIKGEPGALDSALLPRSFFVDRTS